MDRALGKPYGASDTPWTQASPEQNDKAEKQKKAKLVKAGQAMWTRDEMQKLLAEWVLSQ